MKAKGNKTQGGDATLEDHQTKKSKVINKNLACIDAP